MKRFLTLTLLTAAALHGQVDALGNPIAPHAIPLDASGHPMLETYSAGQTLRMRAQEFQSAWERFIAPSNGPRLSDYVKACEKAKVLFPMLHGSCRDTKALEKIAK